MKYFLGHKCPTTAMISATECPDGEVQTATGQSSCSPCSAGNDCSDKTTESQCAAGTYSGAGEKSCTDCATGMLVFCNSWKKIVYVEIP